MMFGQLFQQAPDPAQTAQPFSEQEQNAAHHLKWWLIFLKREQRRLQGIARVIKPSDPIHEVSLPEVHHSTRDEHSANQKNTLSGNEDDTTLHMRPRTQPEGDHPIDDSVMSISDFFNADETPRPGIDPYEGVNLAFSTDDQTMDSEAQSGI